MRIFLRRLKVFAARRRGRVVKLVLCSGGALPIKRGAGGIVRFICPSARGKGQHLARHLITRQALAFVGRASGGVVVISEILSYGRALVTSTRLQLAAF